MLWINRCMLVLVAVWASTSPALAAEGRAERRVALVIGNDDYSKVPKLEKAVSDGKTFAAEMKRAGFEVTLLSNANRRTMNDAINAFKDKIANGGVGVFYFAGHGVQVEGTNFLLPVDIEANRSEDLDSDAINVPNMMDKIAKSKARFSLLVLDACRDNPFPKKAGRSIGGARGMSLQQDTPKGLMVLYSAGASQQALDSLSPDDRDPNGLFTRELVKHMRDPNLRVDEMLRRVRMSVAQKAEAVRHEQNPALYEQATGDFYLYPAALRSQSGASSAKFDPAEADVVFWNSVKDSSDKGDLQAYLDKFPKGQFVSLAKRRLERLSEGVAAPLSTGGTRSKEDCQRESARRDINPQDTQEFVNACLAGREFKLVKSEADCSFEARKQGVHPLDAMDFVNACKYGKPYKVVARKDFTGCLTEARTKGVPAPQMRSYVEKCQQQ